MPTRGLAAGTRMLARDADFGAHLALLTVELGGGCSVWATGRPADSSFQLESYLGLCHSGRSAQRFRPGRPPASQADTSMDT